MSILITILGIVAYLLVGIGVAVAISIAVGKRLQQPQERIFHFWPIIVPIFLIWGAVEVLSRIIEDQTDRWSR